MSNERENFAATEPENDETIGSVIGVGGVLGVLLRFLGKFQIPVVALGKRNLYRVMIQGSGFELPVEGSGPDDPNPNGFFTTRFVAASSRSEAEEKAGAHALSDWQGLSLLGHLSGTDEPHMSVCESEAIEGWFRLTRCRGFTLYADEESAETSAGT